MINAIPFIGWIFSFIFSISLAIPFWLCWTVFGLGSKYFYFVPQVYQHINFWPCVGLFMILSILKSILVPRFVSIDNSNKK